MLGWSSGMNDTVFVFFSPMEGQESVWPCGVSSSGTSGSRISKEFTGEDLKCSRNLTILSKK